MTQHKFNVNIPAASKSEAETKVRALMTLASYLDARELKAFAHVVKNEPGKVKIAKNFLGL